ncbi:MAG TPA: hypothetical protein VJQ52_02800 [Steroidobacteraceae bacterium]|nr:hypothetical protein [Steroidobacteraceae bacterium]
MNAQRIAAGGTALAFALALYLPMGAAAASLSCDLSGYKAADGLEARLTQDAVTVTWQGADAATLRAQFGISNRQPVVRSLEVRGKGGNWATLASNVSPELTVATGKRRMSTQQLLPLRKLGIEATAATPEFIEREKWNVFWDAPLEVPGVAKINLDTPRKPEEVRRDTSAFDSRSCEVRTNGGRLEISFPGLTLGIFSGRLQFTVYRGTNLLRMEAIAKTEQDSVAYKYNAGLKGFSVASAPRVVWQDVARSWQKTEFGGSPNEDPVALRARNRLAIVEARGGSIAVFPPSHKFFFAREIETNLGYVWYRKDTADTFSVGVRQAEREEMYPPYGFADELWKRKVDHSRGFALGNFALYNAPRGTWQRMAAYFYLSPHDSLGTQQAVLAFTHNDRFKAVPGHQVAVSHFHTHFHEQVLDAGSIDFQPPWIPAFRGIGINIAMMSDFHDDGHHDDPGPLRFKEQKAYFDASRRHSDRDFLLMPGEEPAQYFGGHYTTVFPRPVYWSKVRAADKPFVEDVPGYGRVYRTANAEEEFEMLEREGGYIWQTHPRTKGSTLYPDLVRDKPHFLSDRFVGASFQNLPADMSHARICEVRCFGTLDDMNNWAGPKYMLAEGDTYAKFPDDDVYSGILVNYLKLERLPAFDDDWSPILKAIRAGDFFVTTGEVLIPSHSIQGSGSKQEIVAQVEWTFPLEFVEVVWGDGKTTDRQIISATDKAPFGSYQFRIPFDATGKKWVRFAAWDSAGNGAFTQPVHFK